MNRSLIVLCALLAAARPAGADPAGPAEGSGGARVSNAMNPAMSFNGLLLGAWRRSDEADLPAEPQAGPGTGITLEEAEVIFTATVDPYFRADATLAVHDASDHGGEGFEVDLEEVVVTGLFLPRGLGLRAGKMYLPFGRHNLLHTHQYPFVEPPLVLDRLFGHEGLNEAGAELSWLLPVGWFSQLAGAVGDGRNEVLFADSRPKDLVYFGHFKNLWDLSESQTLELGASLAWGRRGADGDAASTVWGGNATWKWRPARRGRYHAFEAQAEYLHLDRDPVEPAIEADLEADHGPGGLADDLTRAAGLYVHGRWQAARRWWLQGRFDRVDHDGPDESRWSALVAFVPSEMSALRLEYATLEPLRGERDHQLMLQLNFTIGSHPAHAY